MKEKPGDACEQQRAEYRCTEYQRQEKHPRRDEKLHAPSPDARLSRRTLPKTLFDFYSIGSASCLFFAALAVTYLWEWCSRVADLHRKSDLMFTYCGFPWRRRLDSNQR